MIPVSNIRFSKLEKKNNQHDIIYLSLNNNSIYLNLPKLKCPFGITKFKYNNIDKYSLNISLDKNINANIYRSLLNVDDWVDDNFFQNKQWLQKLNIDFKSSKKTIQTYSKPIISENNGFPPYINLKLIFDHNGFFFCDIFHHKSGKLQKLNNIQDIQHLLNNTNLYVSSKIVISNVWIMDKKYGVTLKPKKIVFYDK